MQNGLQHLANEAQDLRNTMEQQVESAASDLRDEAEENLNAIIAYARQRIEHNKQRYEEIEESLRQLAIERQKLLDEQEKARYRYNLYVAVLREHDIQPHIRIEAEREQDETLRQPRQENHEFADLSYREAAIIVLERAGRPLLTREIVKQIEAGGRKFKGTSAQASSSVSSALRTDAAKKEVVPMAEQGNQLKWALKKWGSVKDEDNLELEG